MAEIHIQKKRPPVWPWILIILVLIVAAWLVIENTRDDEGEIAGGVVENFREDENPSTPERTFAATAVNDYILFINDEQPSDTSVNEEYIKEGMKKLSSAIGAIADEHFTRDVEINNKADFINQKTDSLENFTENSTEIKELFTSTVEVMNSMQQKSNKNIQDEISKVRESADKIKSNRPVEKQQQEIVVFLKESGDVLQLLAADENLNNNTY